MHMNSQEKPKLLLGCTGSVASIKVPQLAAELSKEFDVRVVATDRALAFFSTKELNENVTPLYTDQHEWKLWSKRGDPVMHIDLRNWADILIVAPLDANTLAKIASGLCDNLLTCIVRAWKIDSVKPVIVAPAMNTAMYEHPFTCRQLQILQNELKFKIIHPITKTLICGETGTGAMAEVNTIVSELIKYKRSNS